MLYLPGRIIVLFQHLTICILLLFVWFEKNNGFNFYTMCRGTVVSLLIDLQLVNTYDWSKHSDGYLSVILVVRDIEGGGVHKQMLPTDLRKHGGGARCSDDLTTLEPADVAVMEMGTGRRNWSSGIRGPHFSHFFCVGLNPPNWAILEGRERWRPDDEKYVNTEEKERHRDRGRTGQWCWQLSQMLSSAQNSARSHHVKAKLAEWTRTTPGPATLNLAQNSTAVSWTNADAK